MDYTELNVFGLRDYARKLGVERASTLKRAELLYAIEQKLAQCGVSELETAKRHRGRRPGKLTVAEPRSTAINTETQNIIYIKRALKQIADILHELERKL